MSHMFVKNINTQKYIIFIELPDSCQS